VAAADPGGPGIAIGVVVTDAEEAQDRADDGDDVVLARRTTDPDDVGGMSAAKAVITELGGSTSHAAVVCREMGVVCVVGCGVDTVTSLAGQTITVDGAGGNVYKGALLVVDASSLEDPNLSQLTQWARDEAGADSGGLPALLRRRKGTSPEAGGA